MFEILISGGWLVWPILFCSVIAAAIAIERFWVLQETSIAPPSLVGRFLTMLAGEQPTAEELAAVREDSALGAILVAGFEASDQGALAAKDKMQETARHGVHLMERYLNALGIIASVSPLLGLLGTVFGMIKVFNAVMSGGLGNADALAGGIAEALITTAVGLTVAVPALILYRVFLRRIDSLTLVLEREATHFLHRLELE